MRLEDKISQLFVFGFKGQEFTPSLKNYLLFYKPGGLIFFSRNGRSPKKVMKLIQDIKYFYKSQKLIEPLFIVDHEGGSVVRIGPLHLFPSALSLGRTKNPNIAYNLGKWTGQYLKTMGFDVNLAPVVDLRSENELLNFIGDRSFSSSPEEVVQMVAPFISGSLSSGVLPVLKHFPGHGRLKGDSHYKIVRKVSTQSELNQKDLIPFKKLIQKDSSIGIMTSHLSVPSLDPSGTLTTFSYPIVSKLRNEYKHKGLVFSDDLDMLYFKDRSVNIGNKAIKALKAGHDQILIVWSRKNQFKALKAVQAHLKSHPSDIELLNKKLNKIITTKLRLKSPPKLSSQSIDQSLSEISKIQDHISYLHFSQLPQTLFQSLSSKPTAPSLFSFSHSFHKEFKFYFPKGHLVALYRKDWKYRIQRCLRRLCYFHVSGKRSARYLKDIPSHIWPHLVIINTSDPSLSRSFPSKKIKLYGRNNKFWKWLALRLKKNTKDYVSLHF